MDRPPADDPNGSSGSPSCSNFSTLTTLTLGRIMQHDKAMQMEPNGSAVATLAVTALWLYPANEASAGCWAHLSLTFAGQVNLNAITGVFR